MSNLKEPAFKYHDRVVIITGFYKGVTGTVVDCAKVGWPWRRYWKYIIIPDDPTLNTMASSRIALIGSKK